MVRIRSLVMVAALGFMGQLHALRAAEPPRPVIAVLPLSLSANEHAVIGAESINALVSRNLEESNLFSLVERERIKDVTQEAGFQNSGLIKDETAVELGKLLGAKFVVLTSCSADASASEEVIKSVTGLNALATAMNAYAASKQPYQSQPVEQTKVATQKIWKTVYSLEMRIVDAETGAITQRVAAKGTGSSLNQVESASRAFDGLQENLRQGFIDAFPLTGYVLEAKGPKILVVDAGKDRGVQVGDRFTLFTRAPDRIHPVTGRTIPGERIALAQFIAIQVDEAVAVLKRKGSGPDQVFPGFLVERNASVANGK